MTHSVPRHTGNVVVVLVLLLLMLAGLMQLARWLGWSHDFSCWLLPIVMLGQTVALWAMSIGAILALFEPTRSTGLRLVIGGVLIATLPMILSGHLGLSCELS